MATHTQHGVILCISLTIFNKFLKIPHNLIRSLTRVLTLLILRNSKQRHTLKIIVNFRLPFYEARESHNLFTSLKYSDKSNVYEIMVFRPWQVILQIGTMTAFPSGVVLTRESSES